MIHSDLYETDELSAQYCEAHYGDEHFGVPNFPAACARICLELMAGRNSRRALDLGCAVGRATFELARGFGRVTGLDFSFRFVSMATRMQEEGNLRYVLIDEGELVSYREVSLSDLSLDELRSRVEFFRGDACDLPDKFTGYDLVLAANLIDRLYSPRRFLTTIHERINPGGLLVITSPYTWLEEFTKREEWLGGFSVAGESIPSLMGIKEILSHRFDMLSAPRDIPFVIRETRRKFQHTISEMTAWERLKE